MIKKFSFWIVFLLVVSIGSMVFIHWSAIQGLHQRTARLQPLYQRQKMIDALSLNLERYRRMSSSFRKLSPPEIVEVKDRLRTKFLDGVAQLDLLDATPEERTIEHRLNDQTSELLNRSAHFEQMLFSKDAFVKPEIQELHDQILGTLMSLQKSADTRISGLHFDTSRSESKSLILLLSVGVFIFILMLCMILRNYFVLHKPLQKLHVYAAGLKNGKQVPQNPPHFSGMYSEIQAALNQLALGVETHMRDRHKFILDIVADLKAPLTMLQAGRFLIGGPDQNLSEQQQLDAAESVRRGLAIFSGSLDDLNDIVDINRLESRLDEKAVDLSELLSDVARTLIGPEVGKRVHFSVPPIPVWVMVDPRRLERTLIQIFSKVMNTLPSGGVLSVALSQSIQGSFRGVEILIQDSDRSRNGRPAVGGPEQDILKHWISENSLSIALSHKVIRAHNGTISASGIAGMSVVVMIRLPQERVMSRGLISPPTETVAPEGRGLFVQKPNLTNQNSVV